MLLMASGLSLVANLSDDTSTPPGITDRDTDVHATTDSAPTGLASTQQPKSKIPTWIPVVAAGLAIIGLLIVGLAVFLVLIRYRHRQNSRQHDPMSELVSHHDEPPSQPQPDIPDQLPSQEQPSIPYGITTPNAIVFDPILYYRKYLDHSDFYMTSTGRRRSRAAKKEQQNMSYFRNPSQEETGSALGSYIYHQKNDSPKNNDAEISSDTDSFTTNENAKPGSIINADPAFALPFRINAVLPPLTVDPVKSNEIIQVLK